MPEYLAPGVFVEETSFRAKTIEGVSTTTTGFIGPASYGPVALEPDLVTSLAAYEQYRKQAETDPECIAAVALATEQRFIHSYERSFLKPLLDKK